MQWLSLWGVAFALVAVRAFQQRNVIHERYMLMIPTSYAFSFLDLVVFYYGLQSFKSDPVLTGLVIGTGAWMGCWVAVYVHKRI